ncbi:MAG: YggS family pyridoxal phosphate-dependent enzyme [Candidatus Omnitrophica bacterium]|nr:YggS family pyridoxal phosphate-dependent enzyme [Candidatus Omnitrophota bacterium]MDD5237677.1 YggS family pyridoxal phosphate-dependent enzyme [Candidatus Omnitrophota bacterium]
MIRDNLLKINERISLVCSKINRDPNEINIVAVTKNRTSGQIKEVIEAGIADIGENRVQEALLKYNTLSTIDYRLSTIKWHMVGHLQTNKAKEAVKIFDLIHSIDSLRLAVEIDKQAAKINKIQNILIEVKTSKEATKFGLEPNNTAEVIGEVSGLKNIKVDGLMTIAPLVDNPEKARPYFRMLRELKEKINELRLMSYELRVLSMGMTDDYQVAIEEGSTMIRLGRAIFEG